MKNRKRVIALIMFCGLANIKLQCAKQRSEPPDYKYEFSEKATITPYQLNYNVGDTIMLKLDIPGKKLFDTKTNTNVFFDSASFPLNVAMNLVFNNPYIADGPFASFVYNQGISAIPKAIAAPLMHT